MELVEMVFSCGEVRLNEIRSKGHRYERSKNATSSGLLALLLGARPLRTGYTSKTKQLRIQPRSCSSVKDVQLSTCGEAVRPLSAEHRLRPGSVGWRQGDIPRCFMIAYDRS